MLPIRFVLFGEDERKVPRPNLLWGIDPMLRRGLPEDNHAYVTTSIGVVLRQATRGIYRMNAHSIAIELARQVAALPQSHDPEFVRRKMLELIKKHPNRIQIENALVFVAVKGELSSWNDSARAFLINKGARELVARVKQTQR